MAVPTKEISSPQQLVEMISNQSINFDQVSPEIKELYALTRA
jgi:hypothetical protein